MGRINVERELEKEGFHPCSKCKNDDYEFNWEENQWVCNKCGEGIDDSPVRKEKVRLSIKKNRWDVEDDL
jgi:ribosomal protein L37AE/L43A